MGSSSGGEQYLKLVQLTQNKLQCPIIHHMSMVHYFDHQFWDPFIAKREMPSMNGEEENW